MAYPQDNGAHERMHADMRFELEDAAADSVGAQQAACDAWRLEFNHMRPHDALRLKTPVEVYRPSEHKMRSVVIGAGFPEGCQTVQLNNRGGFPWLGQQIFVTRALARIHVGLEHRDQEIRVWFHELLLGSRSGSRARRSRSSRSARQPPPARIPPTRPNTTRQRNWRRFHHPHFTRRRGRLRLSLWTAAARLPTGKPRRL